MGIRLVVVSATCPRSSDVTGTDGFMRPMTASASWMGSIGCGTAASARDHVAQPGVLRPPDQHHDGGHW